MSKYLKYVIMNKNISYTVLFSCLFVYVLMQIYLSKYLVDISALNQPFETGSLSSPASLYELSMHNTIKGIL